MRRIIATLLVSILLSYSPIQSADLIIGNPAAAPGTTFSFGIGVHVFDSARGNFFIGAQQSGTAQEYSVSVLARGADVFMPIAPQKVSLNGQADSVNPLFDAGISHMTLLTPGAGLLDRVAVVTQGAPQAVNLIDNVNGSSVIVLNSVADAQGQQSPAVVSIKGLSQRLFAAAVRAQGEAQFGTGASGIALIERVEIIARTDDDACRAQEDGADSDKEKKKDAPAQEVKKIRIIGDSDPDSEDEPTRAPVAPTISLVQLDADPDDATGTPRAALLNKASSVLALGSDLTTLGDNVALHWSPFLNRLFIGVQGTAGGGPADGIRGLAVADITPQGKIILHPIAPDAVFTPGTQDEIVGARSSNAAVTIARICTMRTSTSLDYCIVHGGNGDEVQTAATVYALPLVNVMAPDGMILPEQESIQGTLANVKSSPEDVFAPITAKNRVPLFQTRRFTDPAIDHSQIFTTASQAARVGRGAAPGGITDLFVNGDTVYAVVGLPDVNQRSAVYASQALFNDKGVIVEWTQWSPVSGSLDHLFGAVLDTREGNFILTSGNDALSVNTVKRTHWGYGATPGLSELVVALQQAFPSNVAGIQGLQEFPSNTPGLSGISLLAATGLQSVVLALTGTTVGGVFTPVGFGWMVEQAFYPQGVIDAPIAADTKLLIIRGGELDELGSISASEIGVANAQGWVFVGGVEGLAVLARPDGSGFANPPGLSDGFSGLTQGMAFIRIGDYSFVRKLIADEQYLYVLTDNALDRIDMSASNFGTDTLVKVRLAQVGDLPGVACDGTFLDAIISGKLGLLATNAGLYRVGNGADVRTATSIADLSWQNVVIPDGVLPALQLLALSATGRAQDITRGGGNLYLLNAFIGLNRGRVNRYVIADLTGSAIDDQTVVPFPDILAQGSLSNYANLGQFRNLFFTDGSLVLTARDRNLCQNPELVSGIQPKSFVIPLPITGDNTFVAIERDSASGSLLVAGDFGLLVNE